MFVRKCANMGTHIEGEKLPKSIPSPPLTPEGLSGVPGEPKAPKMELESAKMTSRDPKI